MSFDTFSHLREMRYDCRFLSNRKKLNIFASVIPKVCLQNFSPVLQATICHIPKRLDPEVETNTQAQGWWSSDVCRVASRVRSVVAAKTMEVGALGPAVSSYTRVVPQGSPCTPEYTRVALLIHCWWSSNTGATSWRLLPPHRSGSENGL